MTAYQRLLEKRISLTSHTALKAVDGSRLILCNVYTEEEFFREGVDGDLREGQQPGPDDRELERGAAHRQNCCFGSRPA